MRAHKLEFKCPFALSMLRGNTSWRPREIEIDLQQLFLKFGIVISTHTLSLNQPAIGHYDGAALSFYSLFRILKPHFNAFQLMETDTVTTKTETILTFSLMILQNGEIQMEMG